MASAWRLHLPPSGRRVWRNVEVGSEIATTGTIDEQLPQGLIRAHTKEEISKNNSSDESKEEDGNEIPEGAEELLLEDEVAAKLAAVSVVDSEWEILSEGNTSSSVGTTIIVSKAGSVISLPSGFSHKLSALTGQREGLSIPSPFTIQRSLSNSTIASEENSSFGASCHHTDIVYGIPGVDYVEHIVMPTDTLQGICLSYKVSATRIRQANQFSGTTLLFPSKLIIPLRKNGMKTGAIRTQDRSTKEFKLAALMAEFNDMGQQEAENYLKTSQWDLDGAIRAAGEDGEWEKTSNRYPKNKLAGESTTTDGKRRSGDIHITVRVHKGRPVSAIFRGSGKRPSSRASHGRSGQGNGCVTSDASDADVKHFPGDENEDADEIS